nr:class I SAM-dependent methyltransferase [uncultured Methanoregula sp.]
MTDEQKPFVWQMNTDGPKTYERYIVPTWMLDWTEDLLASGEVGPKKRVLDVACGTGIVARKAAALVGPEGRIAGLDANEGMLRVAGTSAREEGYTAIEWYRSDVSSMPFSPGEFDVVLCHQGLQFFPDKNVALREMARVLAPGGNLALGIWGRPERCPYAIAVSGVLEQYLGADSTALFRLANSLSDRNELLALVRDAGFSDVHLRAETKISCHPSLTELLPAYFSIFPVAAEISAMPEQERDRMFYSMKTALAPYCEDDGLAVPTENYIVTAHKRQS